MKPVLTITCGLLFTAPAAMAETGNSALRDALQAMPVQVLMPTETQLGTFLNIELLSQQPGGHSVPNWRRLMGVFDIRPVEPLAMTIAQTGPEAWRDASGVDLADIRYFAGFGQPPEDVAVWGLTDDAAAQTAFDGLQARGFSPVEGSPDILANGAPGEVNFPEADPLNPWRGPLGQTSAVARSGAQLFQSPDPAALSIIGAQSSLLDTPAGAVLLAAIEAQSAPALQAILFGPAAGMGGMGLAAMSQTKSPTPQDIEAAKAAAETADQNRVPPYYGAIAADVIGDDGAFAVVAMAYATCEDADLAAARAVEQWPQDGQDAVVLNASHVQAGDAGCAAVITAKATSEQGAFQPIIRRIIQRDFAPIRVGG